MRHRIVALDTETTGIPSHLAPGTVRIMQLGYVVCDVDTNEGGSLPQFSIVREYDRLVRLEPGTFVDPASQRIHGLDAAACNGPSGVEPAEALGELVEWLGQRDVVLVGHHLDFDLGILAQEARRLGREDWLHVLGTVSTCCTMEWGRDVCRLPLPRPFAGVQYKNPKLVELFAFLFGGRLPVPQGLHSAIVDARVCAACYLALVARGTGTSAGAVDRAAELVLAGGRPSCG